VHGPCCITGPGVAEHRQRIPQGGRYFFIGGEMPGWLERVFAPGGRELLARRSGPVGPAVWTTASSMRWMQSWSQGRHGFVSYKHFVVPEQRARSGRRLVHGYEATKRWPSPDLSGSAPACSRVGPSWRDQRQSSMRHREGRLRLPGERRELAARCEPAEIHIARDRGAGGLRHGVPLSHIIGQDS
jgi:hypothetical protein